MDYTYASGPNNQLPSYYNLMVAPTAVARTGRTSTRRNGTIRSQMQQKNLIIPLVADFGGQNDQGKSRST
jgi:hypothetical protein